MRTSGDIASFNSYSGNSFINPRSNYQSNSGGSTRGKKIKLENFSNSAAADVRNLEQTEDGTLRTGSVVEHSIFGKGTVKTIENVSGNEVLIVDFEVVGKKKLLRKFAKIDIIKR